MSESLARRDQPGSSAAAEGRRAHLVHRRRRLVNRVALLLAIAVASVGGWTGRYWLLAAAAMAVAISWYSRPTPDPDRWSRGATGEVATAEILAQLPRRFVVLHDRSPPGTKGNIDHLVIGPSGVWVIDSKARRARLHIRRGQVWAGDHVVDPLPAANQAALVHRALDAPVGAIVVIHGSGLRRRGKNVGGVRVIPADRLCRRLRRGRRLSRRQVIARAAEVDRLFPPAR